MELMIVFVVVLLTGVFTMCTLIGYGVNARNHGLFVKVLRLKANGADATEFGNALFDYVKREVANRNGKWQGRYDISPALELLDEQDFDNAYSVVVRRLLEDDFKPVSLDKREKVLLLG